MSGIKRSEEKMRKRFIAPILATLLILSMCLAALADTIKLKDGSVIRGQVIGFRDQQFIVLVGQGSRGRRSELKIFMEDVDSIEFDSTGAGNTGSGDDLSSSTSRPTNTRPGNSGTLGGGNSSNTRP